MVADQSGSGKTLAYLLPLLQRHVLSANSLDRRLKLIAGAPRRARRSVVPCEVVAPTSDLVQQIAEVARVAASRSARGFQVSGSLVKVLGRWGLRCAVVGGGGANARKQRRQLQEGCEVVVVGA